MKYYLQAIANDDATVQPVRHTTVDQDDMEVVKYYLQAIANDDGQGNNEILASLNELAERGDAEVQFILGGMYENGAGVRQDKGEAIRWYQKAAEQGHIEALKNLNELAGRGDAEVQFILGGMYENGIGVRQDKGEAIRWYQKAAEQGHIEALKNLNELAGRGDAEVQFILGGMYENGIGVRQDKDEAVKWYQKAVEQGHVDAQYKLGDMYRSGRGVRQDKGEAVKWYGKAAEKGHDEALKALSRLAKEGHDEALKALSWLAEAGHDEALEKLSWLGQTKLHEG